MHSELSSSVHVHNTNLCSANKQESDPGRLPLPTGKARPLSIGGKENRE